MIPRLVLDNSVSAAWCFRDEANLYTESVLEFVTSNGGAIVPSLWPLELANVLGGAERRRRITEEQREAFFLHIAGLQIEVRPISVPSVFGEIFSLAQRRGLTVYDATYLALAIEEKLPIASQDQSLVRAAVSEGVGLFPV